MSPVGRGRGQSPSKIPTKRGTPSPQSSHSYNKTIVPLEEPNLSTQGRSSSPSRLQISPFESSHGDTTRRDSLAKSISVDSADSFVTSQSLGLHEDKLVNVGTAITASILNMKKLIVDESLPSLFPPSEKQSELSLDLANLPEFERNGVLKRDFFSQCSSTDFSSLQSEESVEAVLSTNQPLIDQSVFQPSPASPENIPVVVDGPISTERYKEMEDRLKALELAVKEGTQKLSQKDSALNAIQASYASIADKYSAVQHELRDNKIKLQELSDLHGSIRCENDKLTLEVKSALTDKEFAQEAIEALCLEKKKLLDRVEELTLELDIVSSEKESSSHIEHQNAAIRNSRQLEFENEQLRTALLRLRDIASCNENVLLDKLSAMQHNSPEYDKTLAEEHQKTKAELEKAYSKIEDLKTHLEDAMGVENLVQSLTDTNLRLGSKMEELNVAIDELESLRKVNNELEEVQAENQKILAREAAVKDAAINELTKRFKLLQEDLKSRNETIEKFRLQTSKLQDELQHANEVIQRNSYSLVQISQGNEKQAQTLSELCLELKNAKLRAFRLGKELSASALSCEILKEELSITKHFVPKDFSTNNKDAMRSLLAIYRIKEKSKWISSRFKELASCEGSINSHCITTYLDIVEVATGIVNHSSTLSCSAECVECVPAFHKLSKLHEAMEALETELDSVLGKLHSNLEDTEGVVLKLNSISDKINQMSDEYTAASTTSNNSNRVEAQFLFSSLRSAFISLERIIKERTVIQKLLSKTFMTQENEQKTICDIQVSGACLAPFNVLVEKIDRFVPEFADILKALDQNALVAASATDFTTDGLETIQNLALCVKKIRIGIDELVSEARVNGEKMLTEKLNQCFVSNFKRFLGIDAENIEKACAQTTAALRIVFDDYIMQFTSLKLEIRSSVSKQQENFKPIWTWRAESMKADNEVTRSFEQRVELLNSQISAMAKELLDKKEKLEQSSLKIEMIEHKLQKQDHDRKKAIELENDLNNAVQRAKQLDAGLQRLTKELEAAKAENSELKKQPKSPINMASPRKLVYSSSPIATDRSHLNYGFAALGTEDELSAKIETLRNAIRFLRAENSRLKSISNDLAIADLVHPMDSLMKRQFNAQKRKEGTELQMQSKHLKKQIQEFALSVSVVDITHVCNAAIETKQSKKKKWMPLQMDPEIQLHVQKANARYFMEQSEKLKQQLHDKKMTHTMPWAAVGPYRKQLLLSEDGKKNKIARITLDNSSGKDAKCINLDISSLSELEMFHNSILR